MSKTRLEKIAGIEEEIEHLKTRQKQLKQEYNAQERKARNHRLCKRGGIVEKHLPELITLTDDQFNVFVEKALLTGYVEKILKGLAAQAAPTGIPDTSHVDKSVATNPAVTMERPSGTGGNKTVVTTGAGS
jgi:hypothetical protein